MSFPFELADELLTMDPANSQPRDLPGRYGRVVRDLERMLVSTGTDAVVAGGWAVWHHGYAGRITQDIDIVIASDCLSDLARWASHFGFHVFAAPEVRWPKLQHIETGIDVDFLPEHAIPGTSKRPAPVPIGHPREYGATHEMLRYISLFGLIELKLGAGRAKDIADLIELIKAHAGQLEAIHQRLQGVHSTYGEQFLSLIEQSKEE